jgi:hypothetical protein
MDFHVQLIALIHVQYVAFKKEGGRRSCRSVPHFGEETQEEAQCLDP